MTLFAVEGAAGTGKTTRLIEALSEALEESPLRDGQKVLALTFMHGARRRLNDRLHNAGTLRRRFECMTIDRFAWRLLRRWRSLARSLRQMPQDGEFDQQCDAAGTLLQRPEVATWIAARFPIIVVDEAQDLKPERLRIMQALVRSTTILLAADEFQCLDSRLRPNPAIEWLRRFCQPEELVQVRRTNVPALLIAAENIRTGRPPRSEQDFQIFVTQGVPVASAYLANAIAWHPRGQVAVIVPSLQGNFARNVVARVCQQPCGQQRNGPYQIRWEKAETEEVSSILEGFTMDNTAVTADAINRLQGLGRSAPIRATIRWICNQASLTGKTEFTRGEIESEISRQVTIHRQRYGMDNYRYSAMTVQQAKNREFSGVVIIWPYQVGGNADHKRRLLYNAVTRAKYWCTVLVQNQNILASPPFV